MSGAKHIRAYLSPIRGLPIRQQERMARDAGIPEKVTYARGEAGRAHNARRLWITSLREGDIAWVPDLRCLVQPREDRGGDAPSADFAACLADLCRRKVVVVDHRNGLSSNDEKWPDHVKKVMLQVASIHRSQAGMRRAARKAAEKLDIGIVAVWRAKPKHEIEAVGAIWRDPLYTEMQAIERLPPDLRTKSPATIRRIFGPRRPGDPKAGGRPSKSKQ